MSQRWIKAAFYRGGSSKGVFFHARDLPPDRVEIEPILLRVLGSPDPNGRQLNGMGGGISSLSKAVIVAPSAHPEADVDYTFIQVAVDQPVCDWKGVCGNLSSAVGPFAVEEGLVQPPDGECVIRIHETSTGKIIHSRFSVHDGKPVVEGQFEIASVAGSGAMIRLDYLDPGGALTGKLLPTGNTLDAITLADGRRIEVSIVDAANGCCFVEANAVGATGAESPDEIETMPGLLGTLDEIRRIAGVMMKLAATPEAVSLLSPRIAMVSAPGTFRSLERVSYGPETHDIGTRMLSMGRAHRAVPLASALCLGVACRIEGTIPNRLAARISGDEVRVGNPSGLLSVGAEVRYDSEWVADSAVSFRTARRLMQGEVAV